MERTIRATSRDVAAAAGVSVATVSYVMNGRTDRRIPTATRDRVLESARELGYAPDRSARMLRRRSTEQVCLVIGSFGVPALDQMAASLHEVGDRHGFGVITMVVNSATTAARTIERLRERVADGAVIATGLSYLDPSDVGGLADAGLPMLVMSNTAEADGFDVYREPEAEAMDDAVAHLVSSGRRRIAYVGHDREVRVFREHALVDSDRFAAFVAGLDARGVALRKELVTAGADDRVAGYQAARSLLSAPEPPEAIVTASSRSAVSAIWAARDLGLRVPEDVAVVGAGTIPEAQVTRPTLSTMGPDDDADFTEAAQMLFDRIIHTRRGNWHEISRPWTFTARGSV
ncbi:LacI family DNA-binding transcriptional regulator [Ruania halotolerans]|uniref:LacI family DNA-binding transcriptional regulator n=1 Tax=Ruania halotolerans TaxID=2897773 RepID=UPI001E5CB089|nr:LacI family DNA-binding transcriptional regulator [Ruania halotolerans]UFU07753.1 LacI family transcriptional regulator [Ruania halotolerans]